MEGNTVPVNHNGSIPGAVQEKEITRYIRVTSALRKDVRVAARKCAKKSDCISFQEEFRNRIGFTRKGRRNQHQFNLLFGKQNGKKIEESNWQKMQGFFSENLSKESCDNLLTLFPKEGGRKKLKIVAVEIIPELRDEIRKITQAYRESQIHKKNRRSVDRYFISRKMGLRKTTLSHILNCRSHLKNLTKDLIQRIRSFTSERFPGSEHEYPILFDITLLKAHPYVADHRAEQKSSEEQENAAFPNHSFDALQTDSKDSESQDTVGDYSKEVFVKEFGALTDQEISEVFP